jgi:hypothetical protein
MALGRTPLRAATVSVLSMVIFLSPTARAEEAPKGSTSEESGQKTATWLVASGGVLFGGTYLISFGMAAAGAGCGTAFLGMDCVPRNNVQGSDWPLFVPVVGPFVAMGTSKDRPIYALAILGAGQVVGAALLVSGLAIWKPTPEKYTRFSLFPSIDRAGAGVSLSSRF